MQPALTVLPTFCGTTGPRTCTELALKEWWAKPPSRPSRSLTVWRLTHDQRSGLWPHGCFFLFYLNFYWEVACVGKTQPLWVNDGIYVHDKDKLLIWGFMEEMQRSAFVEGYALLFAGAVTRVSWMESCVLIGGDLLSFFFFSKGTNQEPGFQSRFVFCYSNRRITRLHSICCWTASVRAPSVNVLFLLCVKTLIKYKYTAECTVCCKCQGVFQVFFIPAVCTKLAPN